MVAANYMPPTMNFRGKIAIVGGSIAGLLAGVLLRRAGWAVEIYERSPVELSSRGAGIVVHDDLFDALDRAGVNLVGEVGVPSAGRMIFSRDGEIEAECSMDQIFTSWGLLYRLLRREFPDDSYHLGMSLEGIAENAQGVRLHFAGHSTIDASWVIAADGVHSTLRQLLTSVESLEYSGYVAWRGLALEEEIEQPIRRLFAGKMSFALPPREHMLVYLVPGPNDDLTEGHRWFNWVWYRPAEEGNRLNALLRDEQGTLYPKGIPPHLIRKPNLDNMRDAANFLLPAQFQVFIGNTTRPFLQPVVDGMCRRMRHGRILFIGDAAFTARPHVGMGVSKAAADARGLSEAFESKDGALDMALAVWERKRLKLGQDTVAWGRRLGSYIGTEPESLGDKALAQRFSRPKAVMNQVAAANPYLYIGRPNSSLGYGA